MDYLCQSLGKVIFLLKEIHFKNVKLSSYLKCVARFGSKINTALINTALDHMCIVLLIP